MSKEYTSLGLMSGTSGDGVDASVIKSDGKTKYKLILDKYFKYSQEISNDIYKSREKVNNSKDLQKTSKELEFLEKKNESKLLKVKPLETILPPIAKTNLDSGSQDLITFCLSFL